MNYQANIEQQQQKDCSGMLYLVKNHATRDLKLQYNWLFSKNMSVLSGPILIVYTDQFSWECCLRHWQHWLGNVWNVVPEWLIQYCIGYFSHRHCLSAMDQHCTNNLFHTTLSWMCSDNIDQTVDCRSTLHRQLPCTLLTQADLRKYCIGYFPAKWCQCALG